MLRIEKCGPLKFLRITHLGIKTTRRHLKQAAFWPGMGGKWALTFLMVIPLWKPIGCKVFEGLNIQYFSQHRLIEQDEKYFCSMNKTTRVFLKVYLALPENIGTISVFIWSLWKVVGGFLFFPFFILLSWFIHELLFVWNGWFVLERSGNFCQMLLLGVDSCPCSVVLRHFKAIVFSLRQK